MPHDFRVYGHLADLDAQCLHACLAILSGYECAHDGTVLDFVHEGSFVDVDADLELLCPALGTHGRGIVDVINHQDWEMVRITVRDGALHRERIALNNALDTAYATENKG